MLEFRVEKIKVKKKKKVEMLKMITVLPCVHIYIYILEGCLKTMFWGGEVASKIAR